MEPVGDHLAQRRGADGVVADDQRTHQLAGVDAREHRRHGVHGDCAGAERGDVQPFAGEVVLGRLEPRQFGRRDLHHRRRQQSLALHRARRVLPAQRLVHDPFVQRVLVDDEQAVVGFEQQV